MRNLKKNYESQLTHNIKLFGSMLIQVKTHPSITELLRSDDTAASSDTETATMFNKYISSVFTCEDITSLPVVNPTGTPLLSDSIEFTPEMVYNKIKSLHNSKSSEPDGWPIPIIKFTLIHHISKIL